MMGTECNSCCMCAVKCTAANDADLGPQRQRLRVHCLTHLHIASALHQAVALLQFCSLARATPDR